MGGKAGDGPVVLKGAMYRHLGTCADDGKPLRPSRSKRLRNESPSPPAVRNGDGERRSTRQRAARAAEPDCVDEYVGSCDEVLAGCGMHLGG